MPASFPGSLATFPSAATLATHDFDTDPHSTLHGNLGLEVAALQAKVGVDGSIVTTSLDYLVAAEPAARDAAISAAIAGLLNSAPGALDTLDELAAALGDDPNFATTVTNSLATKQPLEPTLTALAAYSGTGLVVGNGSDGFTGRSIAVADAKLTVSNGSGVSGNPTIGFGSVASTDLSNSSAIGLHTDKLSAFAATSSSELLGVISDETGSGSLVFGTSPTLTTPLVATMYGGTADTATLTLAATSHGTPATGSDILFKTGTTQLLKLHKSGWTYHGPVASGFPQYAAQAPGIEFNNGGAGAVYSSNSGLGASFIGTEATATNGCSIDLRNSRGTVTSPTATQSGDLIGGMHVGSYGATTFVDSGQFFLVATQNHSDSATGTQWVFKTTPNNTTTKQTALTIGQDQGLSIVGPTTFISAGGTYTASQTQVAFTSAVTYQTTATMSNVFLNYSPTYTWSVAPNGLAQDTAFHHGATYINASGSNINHGPVTSFLADYTKTIDTQTGKNIGANTDLLSAPMFTVANSGTFTSGTWIGYKTSPTLNGTGCTMSAWTCFQTGGTSAAGTVTTFTGLQVTNPAGPGTITNVFGLDIQSLTRGGTLNVGIRNASTLVNTPIVSTITAVGDAIVHTACVVRLNNTSGSSKTLTSAPTITDGQDGETITIFNGSANDVVISDQGTLPSSNLRLVTATITLSTRDSVQLMYSSTVGDWIQISPVTNVI